MNWLIEKAYAIGGDASTATTSNWTWLKPTDKSGSVTSLITSIITLITTVAAALAVIYLIYSGIIYITAAGNPDNAKKGQQGVINAVIGIIIIIAAYYIINVAISVTTGLK